MKDINPIMIIQNLTLIDLIDKIQTHFLHRFKVIDLRIGSTSRTNVNWVVDNRDNILFENKMITIST